MFWKRNSVGISGETTYLSRSPYYLAFKKFLRHPLAKWGGATLFVLYFCITFAEFIAPYGFRTDTKDKSYMQPVHVHFFDGEGRFHLWQLHQVQHGHPHTCDHPLGLE